MNLFYSAEVYKDHCILGKEEARHALRVLRLTSGDRILLTDGMGSCYEGSIAAADMENCRVEILNKLNDAPVRPYKLHVAIAPVKNSSRFEWFLEKSTEIGIDRITPLICERSERRRLQVERLRKILIAAMKQSHQAILPTLEFLTNFDDFMTNSAQTQTRKLMATYEPGNRELAVAGRNERDLMILIGPEGDFSLKEKQSAASRGYEMVNIGRTRLRTETAGVVAASTIAMLNILS